MGTTSKPLAHKTRKPSSLLFLCTLSLVGMVMIIAIFNSHILERFHVARQGTSKVDAAAFAVRKAMARDAARGHMLSHQESIAEDVVALNDADHFEESHIAEHADDGADGYDDGLAAAEVADAVTAAREAAEALSGELQATEESMAEESASWVEEALTLPDEEGLLPVDEPEDEPQPLPAEAETQPEAQSASQTDAEPSDASAAEETYDYSSERILSAAPGEAVCDNSCYKANDGVCDDGRSATYAQPSMVWCDLGTDCADCGDWTPPLDKEGNPQGVGATHVQSLLRKGVDVRLRPTVTKPSFLQPYTDPTKDVDVSAQMQHSGGVEKGLTHIWYKSSMACCQAGGMVVDVGGNFGYYAFYGAAMGCRVVTWEPVPHFRAFLEYGVLVNGFSAVIEVRDKLVMISESPGQTFEMVIPQRGIWGTAGIDGRNIDRAIDNEGDYERLQLGAEAVDDVVDEDVCMFKVDVEGYEPYVLQSAERLFANRRVENVFMEYSPGIWEIGAVRQDPFAIKGIVANVEMLESLVAGGYTLRYAHDGMARSDLQEGHWDREVPLLPRITAENLAHDHADAVAFPQNGLSQPEAGRIGGWNPNTIPEGLHPKSFHSAFGHNCNVWAVRADADAFDRGDERDNVVGVLKPDEPMSQWYTDGALGMGGRVCMHIPVEHRVHHRCKCPDETCQEVEDKIVAWAQEYYGDKLE